MKPVVMVARSLMLVLFAAGLSPSASAAESYSIEVLVISAQPSPGGVDSRLRGFASGLKSMPYKSFRLLDSHRKSLSRGETVTMQFPGRNRFMKVRADGSRGGKLAFTISIDALHFRTRVKIPSNGSLIVGGPKYHKGVILLAVTARPR